MEDRRVKVALAHDYLTQRGGAERVFLSMAKMFPDAELYTSIYNESATFQEFSMCTIRTSWLQRYSLFRRDHRLALPFLCDAWEDLRISDADVALISSSGWAHGVAVPENCKRLVYCHNPARWLYQTEEYVQNRLYRWAFEPIRSGLQKWDRASASKVDRYLANSRNVAERIRQQYGVDAEVLHPPVTVDAKGAQTAVNSLEAGFWLTVARGRGYKNSDLLEEAFASMPEEMLVVVGSDSRSQRSPVANIVQLGVVTEAELRWLYSNARALMSLASEDFGLTPLEANSFGTPAAVLRAGGFVESTDEGVSGVFIDDRTIEAIRLAVQSFPEFDESLVRRHSEGFGIEAFQRRLFAVIDEVGEVG